MRCLPPLTTSLLRCSPRLSCCSPILSLSSTPSRVGKAFSATSSFSAADNAALLFSTAGVATAAAAAPLSLRAGPGTSFTSFELESELEWAQQDLQDLQTSFEATVAPPQVLSTAQTPAAAYTLPRFLDKDRPPQREKKAKASPKHADEPASQDMAIAASCGTNGPCPSLPTILQRRRCCRAVPESHGKSVPGYIDAAHEALLCLHRAWVCQRHSIASAQAAGESAVAALAFSFLRGAHAEALLVLLELAVFPHSSGITEEDASAPLNEFIAYLLPCVMQLVCRRHAELSGWHMAHISQLLISYSPLLDSPSEHAVVWDSFLLLSYATRRRLRRQHNCNCLEAFLWGLYSPLRGEGGRGEYGGSVYLPINAGGAVDRSLPSTTQGGCLLSAPYRNAARRATLHHLLHRCLQMEAPAQMHPQASAHVDLLLSWSLLLAGDEVQRSMRDAVVHRLCKSVTRSNKVTGSRKPRRVPKSVEQWRRLALQHSKDQVEQVNENERSYHGKCGKALMRGAAVFAAVEQEARQTGGWSVPVLERDLLLGMLHPEQHQMGTKAIWPSVGIIGCRSPTRSTRPEKTKGQLNLVAAVTATLRAYARLRWGPLGPSSPSRRSAVSSVVGPRSRSAVAAAPPARRLQHWQSSCEEEIVELMHAALELPQYALCLAEAIAVRLVHCLRLRSVYAGAAPTATPLSRDKLLTTIRRLARHSRIDVLTHALVLQSDGASTVSEEHAGRDAREDPCSFSSFAAEATPALVRALRSAEDAVQVMDLWWRERRAAATSLSVDILRRLRAWVEALPPPLRSEGLGDILEQISQLQTSVPATTSPMGTQLSTSSKDNVKANEAQEIWKAIVAAAKLRGPASISTLRDGATDNMCDTANAPASPSLSTSLSLHHPSAWAVMTPHTRVSMRRLQWIALLNDSPRREWRWSGMHHASAGVTGDPNLRTELCRMVEASEMEDWTAAEQNDLTGLDPQSSRCQRETAAASWSALYSGHWLDKMIGRCIRRRGRAQRTGESKVGCPRDGDDENTTAFPDEPLQKPVSPLCHLPSSPIVLHFVRLSFQATPTHSAKGSKQGSSSLARTAVSVTEAPTNSQIHALPLDQWEEALRCLATYCMHLVTRIEMTERSSARATSCRKLSCAASAFIQCLGAFWQALGDARFESAVLHSTIDVSSMLCEQYKAVLDLHLAIALAQHTPSLRHSRIKEAMASALPPLPDALQVDIFQRLTQRSVPQWQECEELLLFADDVATLCNAGTKANSREKLANTAHTTRKPQLLFKVPLAVYAEVLAAYAVHQRQLPQQLLERCVRSL
ncbi:hypothetical protein ABL78_1978 [Leptomonas seymouri]|uniref:Uncharacterized protein n=1 Tax=Leptomonas seymouri TaxID=5684 RepID=A0A0N1PDP7_LEPSE|nr:hypothetical protein ABL78_1978 [Leptomonas seymouri]|eukprot:KPI88933.1 hypothetical protein ABL78_1978 [Leptomonas seymouri]